jgi:hypothetical protein
MLLDLPGAPCNVTQPGMRTMSQRLRKAQECAAAGGKYGLLQAVLLSLDSQPPGPVQWVREAVALEACSRVLLPEAHQVPLDLDAARAAYQQLTSVEQRLWRHLQAARIQLFHDSRREPVRQPHHFSCAQTPCLVSPCFSSGCISATHDGLQAFPPVEYCQRNVHHQ